MAKWLNVAKDCVIFDDAMQQQWWKLILVITANCLGLAGLRLASSEWLAYDTLSSESNETIE